MYRVEKSSKLFDMKECCPYRRLKISCRLATEIKVESIELPIWLPLITHN